jgi:hypothetical protein
MSSTTSEASADALRELESKPHVVGIARDRHDRLVLLLDEDDENARDAAEAWGKVHSRKIYVKVIGKIAIG